MSTETALMVIIGLLVLILVGVFLQVRWVASAMSAIEEFVESRLNKQNADLTALFRARKYEKVLALVLEKRKSDELDPELDWYESRALFHLGHWDRARESLERTIELHPLYERDLQPYLDRVANKQSEGD